MAGERDRNEALKLSFDPHTIEHLGSNMYSRMPNAVAELVANAYDADATRIEVRVTGSGSDQKIVVRDNGHGMSRNDVREKYLRIGRNRRSGDPAGRSESGRRFVSGKKGLGKLALFGIGHLVVVRTTRVGSNELLVVTMDWEDLIGTTDGDYHPVSATELADVSELGTSVTISRLTRSTEISASDLAASLSRLFQYSDSEVELVVIGRDGNEIAVTRELRLRTVGTEFEWDVPKDLKGCARGLRGIGVLGSIISAEKPLPTQMRGITVYTNGRLANEPEFFGASDSSYAYAYLTGYVQVDALDVIKPDVVATDRRAVNWEHPEAAEIRRTLREMVEEIARQRKKGREERKKKEIEAETGLDSDSWVKTVRGPERNPLRKLIRIIESEETDMSNEDRGEAVKSLKGLAPPYADLVWRHLHPRIQQVSARYFKEGDFHQALVEGCKVYVADLRAHAKLPNEPESSLFGKALGFGDGPRLRFASDFTASTPSISGESVRNLENGQRELAKAIWSSFRNPLSHEPIETIRSLGVISYHDCLDALSLMSHLRRKLDDAKFC